VKQATLETARARVEVVRAAGGDVELAKNALASTQAAYDSALAKLDEVHVGQTAVEMAAAENAVAAAQEGLTAAETRLEVLRAGPNEFDVRAADNAVATARIALEKARADHNAKSQSVGPDEFALPVLQKQAELSRITLDVKKSQWIDAQIVSPFRGRIRTINGRAGDTVQAYTPVIVMEDPSDLIVRADIQEADVPKLAVGQRIDLTLDAFPSEQVVGTIVRLPTAIVTQQGLVQDKSTHIRVDWPKPGAEAGQLARVTITIQEKDDVLKVPRGAVKTVGRRTFVEYMDGQMKRSANVETGIASDSEIEIVRGLQEGQVILVGQ
jgi:multidrug resistance efflux pump